MWPEAASESGKNLTTNRDQLYSKEELIMLTAKFVMINKHSTGQRGIHYVKGDNYYNQRAVVL